MSKRTMALLAVSAFPLTAAAQAFQPAKLPTASRDSFEVVRQGQVMGIMVVSLAKAGDIYTLVRDMKMTAVGGQQLDTVVFHATTLAPISMSSIQSMRGMSMGGRVTVADGKATGKLDQPGPGGVMQSTTIQAPVAAGVIADGVDDLLIRTMDLREGVAHSYPVFDPKTGMTSDYKVKVLGRESLTVPAGTFDAWKLEYITDMPMTMWVSANEPRQLLQIDIAGGQMQIRRAK